MRALSKLSKLVGKIKEARLYPERANPLWLRRRPRRGKNLLTYLAAQKAKPKEQRAQAKAEPALNSRVNNASGVKAEAASVERKTEMVAEASASLANASSTPRCLDLAKAQLMELPGRQEGWENQRPSQKIEASRIADTESNDDLAPFLASELNTLLEQQRQCASVSHPAFFQPGGAFDKAYQADMNVLDDLVQSMGRQVSKFVERDATLNDKIDPEIAAILAAPGHWPKLTSEQMAATLDEFSIPYSSVESGQPVICRLEAESDPKLAVELDGLLACFDGWDQNRKFGARKQVDESGDVELDRKIDKALKELPEQWPTETDEFSAPHEVDLLLSELEEPASGDMQDRDDAELEAVLSEVGDGDTLGADELEATMIEFGLASPGSNFAANIEDEIAVRLAEKLKFDAAIDAEIDALLSHDSDKAGPPLTLEQTDAALKKLGIED